MDICSIGPSWEIDHNTPNSNKEPPLLEEGDCILATGLLPPSPMDIQGSSTISQRLVEAHQANTEAITPIPDYLKVFTSVFSKKSFDILPKPKEWDHTVKLIPGDEHPW